MADNPTAQDVIDAMRFVLMAQDDPEERLKLIDRLLEWAPETDGNKGVELIYESLAEGVFAVEVKV
jgi:hypothetical protein